MAAKVRRLNDGRLLTPDGRCWTLVQAWLEPIEASMLVHRGAFWLVEWCGGGRPPPFSGPGDLSMEELRAEVLAEMVTREQAQRLLRKKRVPTVFVAERWVDETGGTMVLFAEGGPAPRA